MVDPGTDSLQSADTGPVRSSIPASYWESHYGSGLEYQQSRYHDTLRMAQQTHCAGDIQMKITPKFINHAQLDSEVSAAGLQANLMLQSSATPTVP
jgi:hypothetical protein